MENARWICSAVAKPARFAAAGALWVAKQWKARNARALAAGLLGLLAVAALVNAPLADVSFAHRFPTYYMLGKSYEKTSKPTDAITAYQKSNSIKDNYRANYGLGIIYLNQENFNEAAKAFKAALKAEPKGYLAAYNYAIAVESQNKDAIDQNIANWQEFIRLAKNNPKTFLGKTEKSL